MDEVEAALEDRRTGSWVWLITGVVLFLYFGAPFVLVGPFILATGDVPDYVEKLFFPVEWLYENWDGYADYIDWQRQLIIGK